MNKDIDNKKTSKHSEEKEMRNFTIDLPDIEDIPGQEAIYPEGLGAVGSDVTIASDDEEGIGLFDAAEDITDEGLNGRASGDGLTPVQQEALEQTGSQEDHDLQAAEVNDTDEEGAPLNEKNEVNDLDVQGADLDDDMEYAGEEDEENNDYSLPDDER